MNTVIIGEKIMDVAGSIAGVLKPKTGELAQTTANMFKNSSRFQTSVAKEALGPMLGLKKLSEVTDNDVAEILAKMKGKTASEAIDSISEDIGRITENSDGIIRNANKKAEKIISNTSTEDILKTASKPQQYANYPLAYFNSPDKKVNHTRIGAAVGAYAAATVGGRYLSGGTLTTDGYGKKDIAGIPFL